MTFEWLSHVYSWMKHFGKLSTSLRIVKAPSQKKSNIRSVFNTYHNSLQQPGSSCSLGFPAGSKLWAAQLAQFLWFNHMLKLSGLIVQRCSKSCRNVHSDPRHQTQLIPKTSATLQLLDSRAGPKTSIVAPFLGVPPGSMWGGPEASVMQLLPLCVGTLLFHCEGSQWIRTSMTLRWIFLHLRYLSPIRLQFAHWFLMMQMMWMNVNECKWCKWMQMMQMNVKECKWLQTERAQQEDLYQSSPNLPVRSFLAPLHVMNHKGSQR